MTVTRVPRYTIIHGQCLSVGVGGYLLGGGVNALGASARHGFGAQNVLSMKVRRYGAQRFRSGYT